MTHVEISTDKQTQQTGIQQAPTQVTKHLTTTLMAAPIKAFRKAHEHECLLAA